MSKRLIRLTFLTALAVSGAPVAWAGSPGDERPEISASALVPLPPGVAISIEPRDDTDANLRLRDLMAARLQAQHHPVVANAPLRLRFSTETVSSVGPRAGAAASDNLVASDRLPYAATNLNYSEADRFFGPANDRAARGAVQVSYQLRATLETSDGAHVLWTGQASSPLTERAGDRSEQQLAGALAEALADAVGSSFDTRVASQPAPPPPPDAAPAAPSTSLGALRLPWSLPELAQRR